MNGIDVIGKQLPAKHFAIHHILAASQRNDINFILF